MHHPLQCYQKPQLPDARIVSWLPTLFGLLWVRFQVPYKMLKLQKQKDNLMLLVCHRKQMSAICSHAQNYFYYSE